MRLTAWIDFAAAAATALLTCFVLAQADVTLSVLRLDSLAALFMALIALSGAATAWVNLRRRYRSGRRRAAGQVMLGCMLLVCLLADPLLSWLTVAGASAAALYPALQQNGGTTAVAQSWERVPLAGSGLALVLFGIIAAHAGATVAVLAPAGVILGYAILASLQPSLLIVLLALLSRLHDLGSASAMGATIGPMLIGVGLAATLACGLTLLIRPDTRRRLAFLQLGQAGTALLAFGIGTAEAIFAGLVQVVLLVLSRIAAEIGGRAGTERVAIAAGLAGLPPAGVFPGLALIAVATAHKAPWLLAPLGAGLAMLGWATITRLAAPRWTGPLTAAPVWIPLGLSLLIGWLLPASVSDWLHTAAAAAAP
jgi:formate hydrogenlyase subunit 3/multisubunit Na+/H+ antiporter MnhD subunit